MRARFARSLACAGTVFSGALLSGALATGGTLGPGLAQAAAVPASQSASASGQAVSVTGHAVSAKEKAAVIAWVTAHQKTFSHLEAGFEAASNAANKDKIGALHADCLALERVITTVRGLPAIPDPTIEAVFKSSLTNLMDGTKDCISGTSTDGSINPTLLTKASKYWEKGGDQLLKVGEQLDALAG